MRRVLKYRPGRYEFLLVFGSVIQSQYVKFGVNRTFHVLKTQVFRFDLYERYRSLWTDDDNFWQCQSQYTSLNIIFGVNRTFHVVKTTVYRFDLYGRYRILWTDDDHFWWCYLELYKSLYKPKYQIWCESDVPCAQEPSLAI